MSKADFVVCANTSLYLLLAQNVGSKNNIFSICSTVTNPRLEGGGRATVAMNILATHVVTFRFRINVLTRKKRYFTIQWRICHHHFIINYS